MNEKKLLRAINDFTESLTLDELGLASEVIARIHHAKQNTASIARLRNARERTMKKFFAAGGTLPEPVEKF